MLQVNLEAIGLLATAIWALTAVFSRIPALARFDTQLVALVITVVAYVASLLTGYLVGNPVEVAIQVILAIFGANTFHDKVTAPVADWVLGSLE